MSDPLKQFLLQEQENLQKKREPWRYFKQKSKPTVAEILKERDNKNFVESLPKHEGNLGEIKEAKPLTLMDKIISLSNKHYNHPILGAPARWQASMLNNTNPLVGLKETVVPAANGALIATGIKAIPGLAKTIVTQPLRTMWNFVPEMGVGTIGAATGAWLDKNILQGDGKLGMTVGGLTGIKLVQSLFDRARRAMYRNIIPFGYGSSPGNKPRSYEIKETIKEIFSPKPLPTENANEIPIRNWNANLLSLYTNNLNGLALIRFRDQAVRKALNLPELKYEPQIYRLNEDGITYSYDIDNINKIRLDTHNSFIPENLTRSNLEMGDNIYYDLFTTNGGRVGVIRENGSDYMIDRWDLHPFSDMTFFKSMQKIPGIKNLEIIDFLRGNPFILKHKLKK